MPALGRSLNRNADVAGGRGTSQQAVNARETDMDHTESRKPGVGRRGFFAGLAAGLGIAALAAGARKVGAVTARKVRGPVLYRRTEETERYLKSIY